MFGKGKKKLEDKKWGRSKGSTPWNKGKRYKVDKTNLLLLLALSKLKEKIGSQ